MQLYNYILIFLLCNIIFSCSPRDKHPKQEVIKRTFDSTIKCGLVYNKVLCKTDTNTSYALYLPEKYNTISCYPVIIFFDAHAKGSLPLNKYKALADRFGYILACSNNSKNGMSPEATSVIGLLVKKDLLQRFSIDEKRIYTGGFSGGARVAGSLAMVDSSIAGVIGCSAGFSLNNMPKRDFSFVGIAGLNDMNYNELVILDKTLDKSIIHHTLLTFDGKHEWAPSETMKEAFLCVHLDAVRFNKTGKNESLIKDFKAINLESASQAKAKNENIKALTIYKKMLVFLNGISDVSEYQKEIAILEAMPEVQNSLREKEKAEAKEQALQQAYLEAIQTKDIAWWKAEAGKLNEKIKLSANSYEKAMFNRVFGFLSLASYSYVNRSLQMGDFKAAEYFNSIYGIVDPTVPDQHFFAACIYAKKGDSKNMLLSIHEAVKLGLTDIGRIKENDILKPVLSQKEIEKIAEEIKQKENKE